MITFNSVSGQSLCDVCVNTYGSMDYFFKLLQDNGITDPNGLAQSNGTFLWDNTLVVDAQNERRILTNNLKFATAYSGTMNTYYVIQTNTTTPITSGGGGSTPVTPPIPTNMYQKTSATTYTATTDGVSVVTLIPLQNKDILQIERNIEPLKTTEFSWNSSTGVLTLTNPMLTGETLFILYTEMIIL